MRVANLLYAKEYPINNNIKITIPTVGQVLDNQDEYYGIVSLLTAMPIDMMVQLDDVGIDFTTISEYELFLTLFQEIRHMNTSLIFGDLNLSLFQTALNEQNGNIVLFDQTNDIVIDRLIYEQISGFLRKLHHIEKDKRKPGNEDAKKYMIERARRRLKRRTNGEEDSQLEMLITAMVNTEQFKYNFESVRNLSIYQFNESSRQIIKKVDYDNLMHGIYAGTVSIKDISQESLNWLIHK